MLQTNSKADFTQEHGDRSRDGRGGLHGAERGQGQFLIQF